MSEIDCIEILNYLENYKGKKYCVKSKRTPKNRKEMEESEKAGKKATKELEKIAKICEERFQLKKFGSNDWLDGSGQKLRSYLWIQLKAPNKMEKPESVSIFVEPSTDSKKCRFRISIEIHNREAKKYPGEKERYYRYLDRPLDIENGLVYVSGTNEKGKISIISEKNNVELKKDIQLGKYEKVQVSKIIEKIEGLTNEGYMKQIVEAVANLLPYYQCIVDERKVSNPKMKREFDKNVILYGPPGTGKTYKTPIYAVAICEGKSIKEIEELDYNEVMKRYRQFKEEGRIEFTTFHQSYGYEEFIEGIKPIMEKNEELEYKLESGIFKSFCERVENNNAATKANIKLETSPKVWKVSLKRTGENEVREECMQDDDEHIRIGWDVYGEDLTNETEYKYGGKKVLNAFVSKMKIGDIVLSCYSESIIDAIGVVTGECEWNEKYSELKRVRKVKWLVKGIKYNILELNGDLPMTLSAVYELSRISIAKVLEIVAEYHSENKKDNENKNYVFIIDEINRGNISKIFGELITLIEPSKRIGEKEECRVKLPYSKEEFGVPTNVYILGTMNTADRSIALIDTALRRRFNFIEMMPEKNVLEGIEIIDEVSGKSLNIAKMLDTINKRIEILYDREHTIGHAFFMELKEEPKIEKLKSIFEKSIIPLLKEYFYEDYGKIRLILGEQIVERENNQVEEIFKIDIEENDIPEQSYKIKEEVLGDINTYINI